VRDHLVTQTNGTNNLAIRKGPWKLIPANPGGRYAKAKAKGDGKGAAPGPQLYNLAEDLGETRNVAAEHPEIVKELSALLEDVRAKGRSRT
jgi:arylsulfatase A